MQVTEVQPVNFSQYHPHIYSVVNRLRCLVLEERVCHDRDSELDVVPNRKKYATGL